ncbi:MAG: CPBP family intramembrane metalloprotease [Syntrophales bacterium]|nr:CPBP family intramembrane metalloprotease [Syntrophales bacterium]
MITGAVIIASVCWAFTLGVEWGNFWAKIVVSVAVVCAYSFFWGRPRLRFTPSFISAGLASAAVLYGIFFLGNALAPLFLDGAGSQVTAVYERFAGTDKVLVFFLLLFITGPGEEIFWRGFLQEKLMQRFGDVPGFIVSTAVYSSVHIFSMNFVLVMAALIAGSFWGGLYLWKRDLGPVIVSHSFWSAFIFAVFPIH